MAWTYHRGAVFDIVEWGSGVKSVSNVADSAGMLFEALEGSQRRPQEVETADAGVRA